MIISTEIIQELSRNYEQVKVHTVHHGWQIIGCDTKKTETNENIVPVRSLRTGMAKPTMIDC